MHYYITGVSNEFNGVHNINWSVGVLEYWSVGSLSGWILCNTPSLQYSITPSSNPHKITKKRNSYSNEG